MGFLTEREREIMKMLKAGKRVKDIGSHFKVSDASISKSISNAKNKIVNLEDDIDFLIDIGFMTILNNEIKFISRDRDPKVLARDRE
jgi:transcriptional regulator